jgi:hypothetical protein
MKDIEAPTPTKAMKTDKTSQPVKAPNSAQARPFPKARFFSIVTAFFLCLLTGPLAHATPVFVPDFSFENIITGPGGAVGGSGDVLLGTAPNWNSSGNAGNGVQSVTNGDDFFDLPVLPAPGDGTNYFYADMTEGDGTVVSAYCWQEIAPLQSNTIYTLTIAVGETLSGGTGAGFIALVNGSDPFQPILASTPVNTANYTPGTFSNVTLVYTTGTTVSGNLTILMQGNSGQQLVFDNVRLDASPAASPTANLPVFASTTTSNAIFTGISESLETNSIYVGSPFSLSENAAGATPFTYQWLSDNGSGGMSFSPVLNATNSTLSVNTSGFTAGSSVEYEVKVTSGSSSSTSPPVVINALAGPPVIYVDTIPTTAGEFVGDNVTFEAAFVGSGPIAFQWLFDNGSGPAPIPGATNETLLLKNLQMTNSGNYSLLASNSFSEITSDPGVLTVNPASTNDDDGIITETAYQLGLGTNTIFTPTWTLATNSLIAGLEPSTATPAATNFAFADSGGVPVLTDGSPGTLPPAGNTSASLAVAGATAGTGFSISYTLPTNGAPYGWTITNITTYGGWADSGRCEQEYDIYYSTTAAPTSFNSQINAGGSVDGYAGVDFQYPDPTSLDPAGLQCATRVTLTSTNVGGAMVSNVAAIQLFFQILAKGVENGWDGYGEIQVFGTPSAAGIQVVSNTSPQFAEDVVGSAVTFTAAFSGANLTYQWMSNSGSGASPIVGANSTILTLTNLQMSASASYFCVATNSTGSAASSPGSLTVNGSPGTDAYGAIDNWAYQSDQVPFFYPTWTLPPGDLLEGLPPSGVGSGQFILETASGVQVLTDGVIGGIGGGNDVYMATCGPTGGTAVYYTLPTNGAPNGYDLTNLQVFCGWSDQGRDENAVIVYYSTPLAPLQFTNTMAIWDYTHPPLAANPTMTRVSATGSTGPLATNVVALEFSFFTGENGYEGYSEVAAYGTPSANAVTNNGVVLTRDIIPFNGADVAGSSETFTAVFESSQPITYQWYVISNGVTLPVSGGTSASLTLTNLQTAETGSYFVVGLNGLGEASSSTNTFTVNPAPTATNNVLEGFAFQQTYTGGPELAPTWTFAPNDLLLGLAATTLSPSASAFSQGGCGPASNLTDGQIGYIGGTLEDFCSCGSSEGTTAIYTFPSPGSGYKISEIITYGGWQDTGRDWQNYTVSYSTPAAPATFTTLASVVYKVSTPGIANSGIPNMSRVTLTPASGSYLATNVAALQFNFASPAGQENGWQGYSELAVYGQRSVTFTSTAVSGTNLVLGGSGPAGANYTILSATNLLGPWVTNTVGVIGGNGDFSTSVPISKSLHSEFYVLQVP